MSKNVGTTDRAIRLLLGIALIALALFGGLSLMQDSVMKYGAVILGLILAITGLMQLCPLYAMFGLRSCKS
ncbi:YgaP family membrane protein [Pseudooceanicola spongiae]|jgi:uncharacterized sodium:solute symporter family permease YidK|uniref:DUF2892 domain-containing protein n=1 Tax=Pseudooceanicola spongiae TaxID=2613965 RepID=A0A7L9WI21_9RHOB|nr:DUF2892 domain-containing protein [Pseudooceanicola spongiae]QOL79533.1 DUF2892 domain-containing protein [Pseudooceanicola spongiae]|tara:strand:+ start:403 stop:615 length:213 start_codon:yes stop_codon:yes gene_type:complete